MRIDQLSAGSRSPSLEMAGTPINLAFLAKSMNTESVNRIVAEALRQTGCRSAFLFAMEGTSPLLLHVAGFSTLDGYGLELPSAALMRLSVNAFEFADMAKMKEFAKEPLVHLNPGWRYAVNAPVSFGQAANSDAFAALICLDIIPHPDQHPRLPTLLRFAQILSDMMILLSEKQIKASKVPHPQPPFLLRDVANDGKWQPTLPLIDPVPPAEASGNAVSHFLKDTLIKRKRLLSRKSIHYIAMRSWAKPIKQYQINALRSLKASPSLSLIEEIASEMATAITAVHGTPVGASVVPVPCGHSGEHCMSALLAKALARQLDIDCVEAFQCQPQSGSSHPKTNVRRPRMKLRKVVNSTVILVDDVATSGAHLEEAARLLAATAPSVWPIVWIGD